MGGVATHPWPPLSCQQPLTTRLISRPGAKIVRGMAGSAEAIAWTGPAADAAGLPDMAAAPSRVVVVDTRSSLLLDAKARLPQRLIT